MNPGLYFWTAALVNLAIVCATAILGVRCARRGEIARHRQAMKIASWLVVAFLLSYVLKVLVIGREDMSVWSSFDVWVLRFHELFVMSMLAAGSAAWIQSRKLVGTRIVTRDPKDPEPDPKALRWHRRAGWGALLAALLGFALAIGVLAGMFQRALA
jgi:thiosulfate reductase cytochrome b subunit